MHPAIVIMSYLTSKVWAKHLRGSSIEKCANAHCHRKECGILVQLTEDEPHNSGLLNGAEVWVALLDNDHCKQQHGSADAGESSEEHRDTPFVGEEGGDLDLDRIIVVVGDERVGEVANDFGGGGGHLCG